MQIPSWLKLYLNADSIPRIETAIAQAENHTSGEIVPMIVQRSASRSHVPAIIFLLLSCIVLGLELVHLLPSFSSSPLVVISIWVVIIFSITAIASRFHFFQRILSNKEELETQVNMRALNEFYQLEMYKTRDHTGILLYLSMMEQQVVVLADEGISKKLPGDTWHNVVSLLLQGKKKKNLETGIIEAIEKCGEILKSTNPIKDDDTNEIPNALVIKP